MNTMSIVAASLERQVTVGQSDRTRACMARTKFKSLRQAVQQGRVLQPAQQQFSLSKWEKAYASVDMNEENTRFFLSGCWFAHKFAHLRTLIEQLQCEHPLLTSLQGIRLFVGFANLQLASHSNHLLRKGAESKRMFISELMDVRIGTSGPHDDTAKISFNAAALLETAIEAVRFPLAKIIQSNSSTSSRTTLQDFLQLINLAARYHIYESVWQDCIWNGLFVATKPNRYDIVGPEDHQDAYIDCISSHRKDALDAEMAIHSRAFWNDMDLSEKDEYRLQLRVTRRGKIEMFSLSEPPPLPPSAFYRRIAAGERYWDEMLNDPLDRLHGATLLTCNQVARILSLIASALLEHLPKDLPVTDLRELASRWTIPIALSEIKRIIKILIKRDERQIESVLDLFTFKSHKDDPWARPIVPCGDDKVVVLIGPLTSADPVRQIEHWMKAAGANIARRGHLFERFVRLQLDEALKASGLDLTMRVGHVHERGSEEIDVLILFGNRLLVCECKCSEYPVEPLERMQYRDMLREAASQAKRKAEFISARMEEVFAGLAWPCRTGDVTEVIPLVIANTCHRVGFAQDGVAVVDMYILLRYFDGHFEMGEIHLHNAQMARDAKRTTFYRTSAEAQQNLRPYLLNPPQIEVYKQADPSWSYGPLPKISEADRDAFLAHVTLHNIGGVRTVSGSGT